jgi:hypothetical protein
MSRAFPKIWALGHKMIPDILLGEVEVTEKMDGSQFGFGKTPEGEFKVRSKGQWIDLDNPPELFLKSVEHISKFADVINPDTMYYGESITRNKHNTLRYDRVPNGYIVLFAAGDFSFTEAVSNHDDLKRIAEQFGIDCVPIIHQGETSARKIEQLLGRESFLGGPNIEGVVVKRYCPYEYMGQYYPLQAGKFVSEEFKEKHSKNTEFMSGKSRWQMYLEDFRTEARWRKAVEHLRDAGELEGSPRDIGPLLRELHHDLDEEYIAEIKEKLWQFHKKEVYQTVTRGFPQWYKEQLLMSLDSSDSSPSS